MSSNKNQWLQRAEYASLLTSAVGTVAAAISQQAFFATAPLSLSLALNVLNRERLQRQTQYDTNVAIAQSGKQIETRVDYVYQQLRTLPSPPAPFDPTDIHAQLLRIQEAIANLQKNAESTVVEVQRHVDGQIAFLTYQLRDGLAQVPPAFQPGYLEEELKQTNASIAQLSQEIVAIRQCLAPLSAIDLAPLRAEINDLQSNLKHQTEQSGLQRALIQLQLEKLEQHIDQLEDVNQTVINPQLSELISKLASVIDVTGELSERLTVLNKSVENKASADTISQLNSAIVSLQKQVKELPPPTLPFNPADLWESISTLRVEVENLKCKVLETQKILTGLDVNQRFEYLEVEFANLNQKTEKFLADLELLPHQEETISFLKNEAEDLRRELKQLGQDFSERPEKDLLKSSEKAWQELNYLSAQIMRVTKLEDGLSSLQEFIENTSKATDTRLAELQVLFAGIQSDYQYKLVCDRTASREHLMDALDTSAEYLIMVCPWLMSHSIDNVVLNKLEKLIKQKVKIDIGWGHLKDIEKAGGCPKKFHAGLKGNDWYDALEKLEKLEKKFPNQFRLKLLGTHEKFLVCDRKFAMVGSHNFLASKAILRDGPSKEREVGLYTTDPRIIDGLINRFEHASNLK